MALQMGSLEQNLDIMAPQMDPAELLAAEAKADAFVPRPSDGRTSQTEQ